MVRDSAYRGALGFLPPSLQPQTLKLKQRSLGVKVFLPPTWLVLMFGLVSPDSEQMRSEKDHPSTTPKVPEPWAHYPPNSR